MTRFSVVAGDMREVLGDMIGCSIDACVTDSPYGLGFMNKGWDQQVPGPEYWAEVLYVLKPGAHLLAFGGTRTAHRLACAIEDAGFEIRDCISWVYGQGFPKNHNVSIALDKQAGVIGHRGKAIIVAGDGGQQDNLENPQGMARHVPITDAAKQWDGWGSALKPAIEPVYLARKPLEGTLAANAKRYGTGALNIDACRVEGGTVTQEGRWPANLIHDGSAEVLAVFPSTKPSRKGKPRGAAAGEGWGMTATGAEYDDSGSASRFFWCPKASRSEREAGLDDFVPVTTSDGRAKAADNAYQRGKSLRKNHHPTVKPVELLRYLTRLITPPGGIVLDPFCGSGSGGVAAMREGFRFLGVDLDPEFVAIAKARITHAAKLA